MISGDPRQEISVTREWLTLKWRRSETRQPNDEALTIKLALYFVQVNSGGLVGRATYKKTRKHEINCWAVGFSFSQNPTPMHGFDTVLTLGLMLTHEPVLL